MAYELVDQNGKKFNINGFKRGYINVPYEYDGLELYNENAVATNRYPFRTTYRRISINGSYYYPSGTEEYYTDAAYEATEIIIQGKYSNSSYTDYEIYKDEVLVASGSFTSTITDVYTITKTANTSIIISGIWDDIGSKFIYHITTNATITRLNSYQWDNREETTTTVTWTNNNILNKVYTVTATSSKIEAVTFVSESTFKSAIATQLGISTSDIVSISNYSWQNYWKNGITYNNSQSTVMWKTSDSSSGGNWFSKTDSRTSSSSESYTFTITNTPSWGSTVYAWFSYKIGSTNYGPYDCSGSNVTFPYPATSNNWKFSFSVTYKTE